MTHRIRIRLLAAASLALGLALPLVPGMAGAQGAGKPIKIVAPFSVGSGVDSISRIYARVLGEQLGVPVVVENRDGAGGMIGAAYASKQPADGTTLLLATTPFVVGPITQGNAGYDPLKDFAAVARIATNPLALAVNPNVPAKNLRELVAYAKANPGKLTYASSGPGTPSQLEMEVLKAQLGVDIREIPYKSNAQALTDTIAGTVDMYYTVQSTTLANIQGGRLKALAVGALKRTSALPETPTVSEASGLRDYEAQVWYGIVVPAATPADVVRRINAAILKAAQMPEVVDEVKKLGFESSASSPADFVSTMTREADRAAAIARAGKK
ncbi:Bug family tripartite tricarboxylate transporter substrate binding protein [Ramlibacter sp.]|uniref:Bug family tripartite tricarboxylate transporter substrate binding protein n=1 Tax=Ramlibacter sp. TaxID=1917967 RepID=UPI003D0D8FFF